MFRQDNMKNLISVVIALVLASLLVVSAQAIGGSEAQSGGTAFILPSPFDWAPWIEFLKLFTSLLVPFVRAVDVLRKWLKNRGWQKKYKNVVEMKPLNKS